MIEKLPDVIKEVYGEVDQNYWTPQNIQEWSTVRLTNTALEAWQEQQNHERELRKTYAKWVFILITFQIIAIFFLVVFDGLAWINIRENIVKILLPSALGEIFGMGFLVVKYLFSNPNKKLFDILPYNKEK